jgi:threonine synthase
MGRGVRMRAQRVCRARDLKWYINWIYIKKKKKGLPRDSVNSINWAHILAQMVYYFLAYFQVHKQIPHPENSQIQIVVPTGNFGDILAGYYMKHMVLPMGNLLEQAGRRDKLERYTCLILA